MIQGVLAEMNFVPNVVIMLYMYVVVFTYVVIAMTNVQKDVNKD